jgi:hypothetical protein
MVRDGNVASLVGARKELGSLRIKVDGEMKDCIS